MQVEDHPIDYAGFRRRHSRRRIRRRHRHGVGQRHLDFGKSRSRGRHGKRRPEIYAAWQKIKGFLGARAHPRFRQQHKNFLAADQASRRICFSDADVAAEMPRSAISNRLLADIAREGGGDVEKAATGDPAPRKTSPKCAAKPRAAAQEPARKKASFQIRVPREKSKSRRKTST